MFCATVEDLTVIKSALIDISTNQSLLCICKRPLMTANPVAEEAGLRSLLVRLLASSVLAVSVIRRCIIFHKIQLPKRNLRLPAVKTRRWHLDLHLRSTFVLQPFGI